MAIGAYGTAIPISIKKNDIQNMVDISYCYHENLTYDSVGATTFQPLDSSVLTPAERPDGVPGVVDSVVEGMYNLQLPVSVFNKKGFYTVYIKPKEIPTVISDVGTLTAYPNVRGIVLDATESGLNSIKDRIKTNNSLVGYRVVYIDDNGDRMDHYRIITSSNKCEPVVQTPNSSSDKSYTYRYDDSSSLVFVTLSPSSAPSFKSNATPYIGKVAQKVLLINTLFEPIQIDIEMVENDADTLATLINGSQLRDLDNGLITTYNGNNQIVSQSEVYTLKETTTGVPRYEVKKNKGNNINFSETIEDK